MASWDNINLPAPPTGRDYAGPLLDFSKLGNLGNQYFQGQEQNAKLAQLQAFKDGVPIDPATGKPDVNAMTQTIARLGGTEGAIKAMPLFQRQQFLDAYMNQRPPSDEEDQPQQQPQPQQRREPVAVTPYGLPVQQATEGMVSAVPDSGPNAGRNIAPEINAAAPVPTRVAQAAPAEPTQPSLLPPGVSEKAARNLERTATWYANRANVAESQIGKGAGAGDLKLSEQFAARAAKMRDRIAEHDPSVLEFDKRKTVQADMIKASAAKYAGIQAAAHQYEQDQKPYIDLSRGVFNDPRAYSGIGANKALAWNQIKAIWGDQSAAALQEGAKKLTAASTLSTINQQKDQTLEAGSTSARIFSQQVDLAMKSSPGLENTPTGNRFLVEVQARTGETFNEIARMAREYRAKHGGILDDGFDAKVAQHLKDNPLFTKTELANPALIGAPQVPDAIAKAGKGRVIQWLREMGLGTNDVFRTHTGEYVKA